VAEFKQGKFDFLFVIPWYQSEAARFRAAVAKFYWITL
jgi:hypothetical protein